MERELNLELSKGEGKLNLELALRGFRVTYHGV